MSDLVNPEVHQPEPQKVEGRWRSLFALAFSSVIDNSEGGLINNLFPLIRQSFEMSLGALGVFTSISRFARMLFGPLWAMAADKFGRKKVLVFITGVWGIWTALAGLAQNYTQLVILYTIGTIGTVASEPIANGILADLFDSKERGKAYGTIRSVTGLAGVILIPLIGQLANVENGWRIGMIIFGVMSVVSGVLISFFVKEPEEREGSLDEASKNKFQLSKVPELLKNKTFLLLGGTLFLVTSLILFSYMVTFLVDVRGYATDEANNIMAIFVLGWMVSSLVGGLLGDWVDKKSPTKGRIALMQVYMALFALVSFLAMQIPWSDVGMYIIWFVFGAIGSIGFSGCALPMLSNVVPPEMSGTAFSLLYSFLQGLISAVYSLTVGFLAERYGLQKVMLWTITIPYALNVFYWFLLYKTYPKDLAANQAALAEAEE